jgi:hypothetical protein
VTATYSIKLVNRDRLFDDGQNKIRASIQAKFDEAFKHTDGGVCAQSAKPHQIESVGGSGSTSQKA